MTAASNPQLSADSPMLMMSAEVTVWSKHRPSAAGSGCPNGHLPLYDGADFVP